METKIAAHPSSPTPGVMPVLPSRIPQTDQCETSLQIGLFFDGTGNNKNWDGAGDCNAGRGSQASRKKDSNVARLFYAYPLEPDKGYYPLYVAGVGTPFPAIGEVEPATFGMAFGEGGEGRITFGLFHVVNSIHQAVSPDNRLAVSDGEIRSRCGDGNRSRNKQFLNREAARIEKLAKQVDKPKITEIFIDVFGFSRGAAEARVFCTWLNEMFQGNTLCGIPAKVRMLGIFDTVASVGLPTSTQWVGSDTDGHMAWATPQNLQIAPCVKNCVHYISMHENRPSFPLDRIVRPDGSLPPGGHEYAFPGMHSDVGGGYAPGEQGRGKLEGVDAQDSEKLSQIPLNYMLKAAQDAKVPLDADLAVAQSESGGDPFKVDDGLQAAYDTFSRAMGSEGRAPRDWLMPYLTWRVGCTASYPNLPWHKRASQGDINDLVGANEILKSDIKALDDAGGFWKTTSDLALELLAPWHETDTEHVRRLSPEAGEVLQRARNNPAIDGPEATMFGIYAHDSFAGFRPFDTEINTYVFGCRDIMPGSWEPEGYLRYRRFYTGTNQELTFNIRSETNEPWKPQIRYAENVSTQDAATPELS